MNNSIEIIGIDHGWSQMKTSNYCFNTSIKELPNVPAFTDNVLQYDNRHFAVGDERLEVLDSKVENENFYLLTLVAMAKEMKSRGLKEADIALAVGLENLFNGIDENIDFLEKKIESYKLDMEASKAEYEKPFAYEEELKSKIARQYELNAQLDLENGKVEDVDLAASEDKDVAANVAEEKGPYRTGGNGYTR